MRDPRYRRRKEGIVLRAVNGHSLWKVEVVKCNIDIIPDSAYDQPLWPRSCNQWQ